MTGKHIRGGNQPARMQVNVRLRSTVYDRMVSYARTNDLSQSRLVEEALQELFHRADQDDGKADKKMGERGNHEAEKSS